MKLQELPALFKRLDVVRQGHFLRASGRHSDHYVQCAHLFEDASVAAEICSIVAEHFKNAGVQLVVSPAIGAILFGFEVSRQMGVRNIYAERRSGAMVLRRDFAFAPGTRVLILEDEVTTGTSVRETVEVVRALGGQPVGISCIVDKSGGSIDFGLPYFPLYTTRVNSFDAEDCPLCKQGKKLDNA